MPYFLVFFLLRLFLSSASAEPVRNSFVIDSPWAQSHRTAGMQASTPYRGIEPDKRIAVTLKRFRSDIGKNLGTSPWLILSSQKYTDAPNARTLWGSSLKGVFKYKIDGNNFSYVDHIPLKGIQSISWNIVGITGPTGDRMIVPQPNPLGGGKFLILRDGSQINSKIRVMKEFELDQADLTKKCNPPKNWRLGYSGTSIVSLPTGQLAFKLLFRPRWYQQGKKQEFVAITDNALNQVLSCSFIDDSEITNQVAYEPIGNHKTDLYYATESSIVKLRYDAISTQITRLWEKEIPFRNRTGTTPTLVGYGKDKFIVTVDGRCAVTNVFTGKIACSKDQSPAKIYAVRRDSSDPKIYSLDLPHYIKTIENSPASSNEVVVVTNYAGYKADADERGVVAVKWDRKAQSWKTLWGNPRVQISGVPTISSTSNLVYGTGTDVQDNKNVYLHGLCLLSGKNCSGGQIIVKAKVGASNLAWDPGNNIIINDDQSMMYSTPVGVARIYHH